MNLVVKTLWLWMLICIGATSGDYTWDRLHRCLTPEELTQTVAEYETGFPCLDCREHFQSLLRMHPFPLGNVYTSEDVRVWTWLTHNLINERLNKPWVSFDVMMECGERFE